MGGWLSGSGGGLGFVWRVGGRRFGFERGGREVFSFVGFVDTVVELERKHLPQHIVLQDRKKKRFRLSLGGLRAGV